MRLVAKEILGTASAEIIWLDDWMIIEEEIKKESLIYTQNSKLYKKTDMSPVKY